MITKKEAKALAHRDLSKATKKVRGILAAKEQQLKSIVGFKIK
jgi:hypothetical protein